MRQDRTRDKGNKANTIKTLRKLHNKMVECYIHGQSLKYTKVVAQYNSLRRI